MSRDPPWLRWHEADLYYSIEELKRLNVLADSVDEGRVPDPK